MELSNDIMTTGLVTIAAEAPIARAHGAFQKHGIRHLPVLQSGRVVGLLSERDIRGTMNLDLCVRDFMSSPPVCIEPQSTAAQAAALMRRHKISSLLVVENARLKGILTSHDLLGVLENLGEGESQSLSGAVAAKLYRWTHATPVVDILAAISNSGI